MSFYWEYSYFYYLADGDRNQTNYTKWTDYILEFIPVGNSKFSISIAYDIYRFTCSSTMQECLLQATFFNCDNLR